MDKTEIHINDFYKNYPEINAPKNRYNKTIDLNFIGSLTLKLTISYDANDKYVRITDIEALIMEKEAGSKTDVSINTNNSVHEGKHVMRVTVNFSYNTFLKNEVGSIIFKLTQNGDVVQYDKTNNISEIQVVNGGYNK